MKLESVRSRATKIVCQDIRKVPLSLVPPFIAHTNAAQDKNGLLRALQVSSGTARLVKIVEMHKYSSVNSIKALERVKVTAGCAICSHARKPRERNALAKTAVSWLRAGFRFPWRAPGISGWLRATRGRATLAPF